MGSGYLPYIKRDGKIGLLTFKKFLENEIIDDNKRIMKSIVDKIFPNMYVQNIQLEINTKFENKDIINSILKNTVTNILLLSN